MVSEMYYCFSVFVIRSVEGDGGGGWSLETKAARSGQARPVVIRVARGLSDVYFNVC